MKPPSTRTEAVRMRLKRLHDRAWAERIDAKTRRSRALKTGNHHVIVARTNAKLRVLEGVPSKALADRVRHHLSRGRDAADIAIRERIPVSAAESAVTFLKSKNKNTNENHRR